MAYHMDEINFRRSRLGGFYTIVVGSIIPSEDPEGQTKF